METSTHLLTKMELITIRVYFSARGLTKVHPSQNRSTRINIKTILRKSDAL